MAENWIETQDICVLFPCLSLASYLTFKKPVCTLTSDDLLFKLGSGNLFALQNSFKPTSGKFFTRDTGCYDYSDCEGNFYAGACWPEWNECVQQQIILTNQTEVQIPPSCLPPPKSAVTVRVLVCNDGNEERQDEQCLYVTARQELQLEIRSVSKP